jgi:polyol permease family
MSTQENSADSNTNRWQSLISRFGIPPSLFWGFVGVLLFMIGDGIELGYLQTYMVDHGFNKTQPATLLAIYGIAVAIASWFSGALSEIISPRKVMGLGLGIWVVFEIPFLYFLGQGNYSAMLIIYFLRGFGYPLFAYGFLVWISAAVPEERLGTAVGWFWFAFTGGLPTIASFVAGVTIPIIGTYSTFWFSLVFIIAGGLIALVGIREPTGMKPLAGEDANPIRDLLRGITILWRDTRTGVGGVCRVINTTAQYGFFAMLPVFFTTTIGFSLSQWLFLTGMMYGSNIIFNLIFGAIGDRIGWRNTITYFGGLGCAITTLALYYIPLTTGNYPLSVLAAVLYGATLAGYVPLSALMPSMVPDDDKGSSMAILNLGAGLATFVGPAIVSVTLSPFGVGGTMWIFAIIYVFSAILSFVFLRDPSDPRESVSEPGIAPAQDD